MSNHQPETYLFSLRLWQVATSEGEQEWRGKLQFLPAGEAVYFQTLPVLLAQLEGMLEAAALEERVNNDSQIGHNYPKET